MLGLGRQNWLIYLQIAQGFNLPENLDSKIMTEKLNMYGKTRFYKFINSWISDADDVGAEDGVVAGAVAGQQPSPAEPQSEAEAAAQEKETEITGTGFLKIMENREY